MQSLKKNALFNLFYISTLFIHLSSSLNTDGLSLLALKSAIAEDPNRALISWSELDATPCRWAGIVCDRGRVISVSLPGKNLTGYIPSEIGALSFLAFLDLSHNFFSGPLPQQIAALQSLVHFDISSNNFNGSLLQGLSNLTRLQGTLNLSYNSFSGEIPASFGRFPVMVSLDLRCNNLSGKIPEVGSLLNQGPTAFSGNLFLCGFPLSTPCTVPEAKDPIFFDNPQKPGGNGGGGVVEGRKINGKSVAVSVICGVSVVVGVVAVTVWVIRKRWNVVEEKLGKRENVELGGEEEGKKGKFVVMDQGFGLELEDLLRASAYVLGKSRSGIVYRVVAGGRKGVAAAAPVVVAVRRLSEGDVAWRLKEFEAEVEAIGKVRHPNVVRLRAYYYASDEKLLISDFISNGSLYNALHGYDVEVS
ncbi:receptor protein kinase-like protein At4g34220 isoform X2 [Salvia hispanica]|uniref:receptor protein kinase-like protein At4g34220 isoform X2 n=1 Tax=Salvia hispanica TaxID=49212 RepID=UPI002009662C|nr:receptor protein kinase-like protein At4g34220 isoform X2 [Salvia hispanica]